METEDLRDVSYERLNRGYGTQWELMDDLFAWLDLRLYVFYKHHQWLGPKNDMRNMLGLVVSREEFEHNLVKASQRGLEATMEGDDAAQLESSRLAIDVRLDQTGVEIPLLRLFERLELDAFEQNCVFLAYAAELDKKYEKLLAYLQDDITRKHPSTALAVQLFLPMESTMEEYLARFSKSDRFTDLFETKALEEGSLILRRVVLEYLSTGTVSSTGGVRLFDGAVQTPRGDLIIGQAAARRLDVVFRQSGSCAVCVSGGPGSGKKFQVEHLMRRQQTRCVFADLAGEKPEELAREAILAARLTGASLCCCCPVISMPPVSPTPSCSRWSSPTTCPSPLTTPSRLSPSTGAVSTVPSRS